MTCCVQLEKEKERLSDEVETMVQKLEVANKESENARRMVEVQEEQMDRLREELEVALNRLERAERRAVGN